MGTLCCGTSLTAPARTDRGVFATPSGPAPIPAAHARLFAPVRTKLWELPEPVHCSVVGTCLSTEQLRKLLARVNLAHPADTDYDLHGRAVAIAGQHTAAAKMMHKLLDTTHAGAVRRFGQAATEAGLRGLWEAALDAGDVPGPYWAVLTHPACSYGLRQDGFGRVHMLSHLVGAANRADLRRLAELEAANAALQAKVERQQARLQQVTTASNDTIGGLRDALSHRAEASAVGQADPDTQALRGVVEDLRCRLHASEQRAAVLEGRLADRQAALDAERAARDAAGRLAMAAQAELAAAEAALSGDPVPPAAPAVAADRVSLLYVGGRPHAVAAMRGLADRMSAALAHHDGGVEDGAGLLPGLVGRADLVLFPVDCVSHEAALAIKRLCRNGGKRFLPLRSAGLGAFLAALRSLPVREAA